MRQLVAAPGPALPGDGTGLIGSRSSAPVAAGPDASAAVTTDTAGASGRTTLLIADDDEVTRSGLRTLLTMQPGLVVKAEHPVRALG
ncbi:hypothetical protein [Streptomyces kanamyceticus]|uniref:hypothetical protein n=1 Tax=Streptomyces kanamyceticus TaxID=1967 RepID=UPI0037DC4795